MIKSLYTIIYVPDVNHTMDFYQNAFKLQLRFMHESKCYGELEAGSATLAFALETFAHENLGIQFTHNRPTQKPGGFEVALVVENVQAAYQHALENGAQPLQAPNHKPWGQEVSYVLDCNGVIVELCGE